MDDWVQWLKTLMTLVLIISFLEMILPDNELKKFSKLTFGLVIMLATLQPILAIIHWNWDTRYPLADMDTIVSEFDWEKRGREVFDAGAKPVFQAVEENVERKVQSVVMMNTQIDNARVKIDYSTTGEISKVYIDVVFGKQQIPVQKVTISEQEKEAQFSSRDIKNNQVAKIKRSVAHYLDIAESNIYFNVVH